MRAAIFTKLKEITAFGDRVFQAFTAPSGTATPYCTFKVTSTIKAVGNRAGQFLGLEVYIYGSKTSFVALDTLVKSVIGKLDKVTLTYSTTKKFVCELDSVTEDMYDETDDKFVKRVSFYIAQCR